MNILDCRISDLKRLSIWLAKTFDLEYICITKGEKGCAAFYRNDFFVTTGIPVKTKNTIGCGGFSYRFSAWGWFRLVYREGL